MLSTAHDDNSIKQTNIDLGCELQPVMFRSMYFCIPQALPSYLTTDDFWSPTDIKHTPKEERKKGISSTSHCVKTSAKHWSYEWNLYISDKKSCLNTELAKSVFHAMYILAFIIYIL